MNTVTALGYAFGPFMLNLQRMSLQHGGQDCDLRPKAFDVLRHLVERSGQVVTKDELVAAAWPDVIVSDDALTQCIRDIRRALGDAGEGYIKTVPRRGYLFAPDAMVLASGGKPERGRLRATALALAAALSVAVATAATVSFVSLNPADVAFDAASPAGYSVAVLAFDETSGDPDLAHFGPGVSEDIISMLARVPNLSVVARNSSFKYRGQAVDVRKIGEDLGVTHVLEGSVRKESDRLRIVAQLIDAGTARHVWAERFDRTGTDPRALQDEVTQKIVAALAGTAGSIALQQYREAWGKDSANLQEYDYVLRVLSRIAYGTPEMADAADAMLAEGLLKFPDSSMLKAQAASTVIWRFARGWSSNEDPLEDIRRAGELARDALLDPTASPMMRTNVHITLAYVNMAQRRFDQAVADAEAALALAPYDGRVVYYLAEIPMAAGRPSLALEWIERAAALYRADDPRQQELASMKANALLRISGPAAALDVMDGIHSNDAVVLRTVYILRAIALVLLDRLDEAKLEIARLRELDPSWTLAKHRRRFFYTEPQQLTLVLQALAAADLPEH